jgi:hypothetical protein
MDITITLTAEQAAHGAVVGGGDLVGLCTRLIVNEAENWADIAARSADAAFLAKRDAYEKADGKATKEQIEAEALKAVAVEEPIVK